MLTDAQKVRKLRSVMPPPNKLRILAAFMDALDIISNNPDHTVQNDLRKWAKDIAKVMRETK